MDTLRLAPSIRRITVLQPDPSGVIAPLIVYERRGRKKKGSRELRPFERLTRGCAKTGEAVATTYVRRHRRSNRKRRDGWVRDMSVNVARAARKGFREGSDRLWLV
jgi:Family of unknown function (DUF6312)